MKNIYLHLLFIVIAGLIAYSNSFTVPFQFDDRGIIVENPLIRDIGNVISPGTGPVNNPRYEYNTRRFVGYLTLALNYRWGGLDVTGYHVVNLLIHLINAILVYFFVLLTFRTPYFNNNGSKKLEVSSDKEETGNSKKEDNSGEKSLLTTHYSLLTMLGYSRFIALFSALLFVSHPVQTQAVTYIVQRFTSLATLFYLLSMVMYIKGRISQVEAEAKAEQQNSNLDLQPFSSTSALTLTCFILSLVSAVCAMKTKEIAFTLPIMILLYEFTFFKSSLKKKLLFLLPVLLTLVIIPMSMLHIDKPLGELLSDLSARTRLDTNIARGDYLMTEMRVIVTYIRLIFLPVNQNLDYDYPISRSFFTPPVFLSFSFLFTLFGTAVYLLYKSKNKNKEVSSEKLVVRRTTEDNGSEKSVVSGQQEENGNVGPKTNGFLLLTTHYSLFTTHCLRLIAFGILWFFLALSVESSFIPIVDVIFEHRLYLPSAGAFIALAAAFSAAGKRWPHLEKATIPLALIIVLALSGATFARNRVWQDELGLWEDVVKKSANSPRPHNNLGFFYSARGMNDQAIGQFLSALRLRPNYPDARINLSVAYNAKGMYDLAIDHLILALTIRPDDPDAYNNLGIALVSKGMPDEGITHYKTALKLQPDYPEVYNNLGVAYGSKGLFDQARENFEHAIRLKPDYFEAYFNLALVYEKTGDYEKAASLKNKAREINPAYR